MQPCVCRARVPVGALGAEPVCSPFTARCSGLAGKKRRKHIGSKQERKENKTLGSPKISCCHLCPSPFKFSINQRKNKTKVLKWPECRTNWSCSQSTDHEKLVGVLGWKCLTLHHVVAGRFSGEIFKGLQYEDWITACRNYLQPESNGTCKKNKLSRQGAFIPAKVAHEVAWIKIQSTTQILHVVGHTE